MGIEDGKLCMRPSLEHLSESVLATYDAIIMQTGGIDDITCKVLFRMQNRKFGP
jgi:hypothetical protein